MAASDVESDRVGVKKPTSWYDNIDLGMVNLMAINFFCSVGIIFTNKMVFFVYNFRFGTLVTALHFLVTALLLHICKTRGLFEAKPVDLSRIFTFSSVFCLSIVFNNLSLQHNSVGFYQMMKILTTPVIVVIEQVVYSIDLPNNIKLSLLPVCVGVALATVTDLEANFVGTMFAGLGVITSSVYQIWARSKLKELEVNSFQLLYYQAPMSCVMLMFLVPFLDDFDKLVNFEFTAATVFAILASAIIAFGVNLSTFLVIGRTSPVTYNVLGHCKTCVILVGGFVLFGAVAHFKNVLGIVLTMIGIIAYTHLKLFK